MLFLEYEFNYKFYFSNMKLVECSWLLHIFTTIFKLPYLTPCRYYVLCERDCFENMWIHKYVSIWWGRCDSLSSFYEGDSKTSGPFRNELRPEWFQEDSGSSFLVENMDRPLSPVKGRREWHTGTSDWPPFPGSTRNSVFLRPGFGVLQ